MCRMTIYKGLGVDQSILLSDLIIQPEHSIIQQSYNAKERFAATGLPPQINGDGFGIGWYAEGLFTQTGLRKKKKSPQEGEVTSLVSSTRKRSGSYIAVADRDLKYETPCVFTSITPAWNNRNLYQLAEKVSSPMFFAHIRAASLGSLTTEVNCHPFTFDKYMWMHNGGVAEFQRIRRRLVNRLSDLAYDVIVGNTDSEHCFGLFLTILGEMGEIGDEFSPSDLRKALIRTIVEVNNISREAGITDHSLLNFAVTDGKTLLATRYVNVGTASASSLYFTSGSRWVKSNERPDEYIMQRAEKLDKVVLMASERLSTEYCDWMEVPKNHIVTVTEDINIQIHPINTLL